jgi:hypothetical protein
MRDVLDDLSYLYDIPDKLLDRRAESARYSATNRPAQSATMLAAV